MKAVLGEIKPTYIWNNSWCFSCNPPILLLHHLFIVVSEQWVKQKGEGGALRFVGTKLSEGLRDSGALNLAHGWSGLNPWHYIWFPSTARSDPGVSPEMKNKPTQETGQEQQSWELGVGAGCWTAEHLLFACESPWIEPLEWQKEKDN